MCEYKAGCGPLHSVGGSQSTQSWTSRHCGLNVVGNVAIVRHYGLNVIEDVAIVRCKKWVLNFRAHGGRTALLKKKFN